jgi:hypothetical protein
MTRAPIHVVGLLDHSDHRADSRCPCEPEPVRDLAEPAAVVYLHRRPLPDPVRAARVREVVSPSETGWPAGSGRDSRGADG